MTFLTIIFLINTIINISTAYSTNINNYIYGGCSHIKYLPNSQYESNLNSLLTTLVNSAMYTPFNKFTTGLPNSPVSGLYQCRADLSQSDCTNCVQHALTKLGVLCGGACGGVVQFDGCLIKYDNSSFLGVQDKTVVFTQCGNSRVNSDELTRRDRIFGYMMSRSNDFYRVGLDGNVQGVAQCVGDLNVGQCNDCLGFAIQRFKSECGFVESGDVFLGKCYVRVFVNGGSHDDGSNGSSQDDEIEKTLALLIGLIAGIALIVILFAFLRKLCEGKDGK